MNDITALIRRQNDLFRTTLIPSPRHKVVLTEMVSHLEKHEIQDLIGLVRSFTDFDESNDPYHEHDFGAFDYNGERYYWKIDLYEDGSYVYGWDPESDKAPWMLLTLMHSSEY